MTLIRRRERTPAQSASSLSELSPEDYRTLVNEVDRCLRSLGAQRVDIDGSVVHTDRFGDFGLTNLARTLRLSPHARWSDLIQAQLTAIAHGSQGHAPLADLRSIIMPRLLCGDFGLPFQVPSWAKQAGAGLFYVAAVDHPDTIELRVAESELPDGWGRLWDDALTNLRRLGVPEQGQIRVPSSTAIVHFFAGDIFGASRLAIIDDLLADIEPDCGWGLIASVPCSSTLFVHVVKDQELLAAINYLVPRTGDMYSAQPGALSPWLYYRRDAASSWEQVTRMAEDGNGTIVRPPEAIYPLLQKSLK